MSGDNDAIKNNANNNFTLLDYYNILLKYKINILITVLITALLTAVMVFYVMKPVFLSTATVKTTSKTSGLAGLMGQNLPDIGDLGDLGGGTASSKELALFENILLSRRCLEEAIVKFKLNDEWEFKFKQDAIKNFRENILDIKKDKLAGTMEIGVFDVDQQRAKDVAEFLIYQLNKINTELNVLNAKNNREFIEQRYQQAKIDLRKAEDSLKQYQDKFGVAPDVIIKGAVQAEIQLESEIKSEEVKLEILKKIISPNESEVKIQEEKISVLKNKLLDIKENGDGQSMLRLKGAPEIVLNYFRLQRDIEIQNKLQTILIPMFEQAKIEEKKEMPSVLVLDPPFYPDKKTKPKRMTLILIFMIISFMGSFTYVVIREKIKNSK